ncbi:hypothetical protein FRC11_011057 [Ceratobasidium sp. 423]|nr:hypothetical protein FRC11_011057 [Ceratobasidium sp. 423]
MSGLTAALHDQGHSFTPPVDGLLAIPTHALEILPSPNTSVKRAIIFIFPPIAPEPLSSTSIGDTGHSMRHHLSANEPVESIASDLIQQHIPSKIILEGLKLDLSEDCVINARSIAYLPTNGGAY